MGLHPAVIWAAIICCLPLSSGLPEDSEKSFSTSSSVQSANGYHVTTTQINDNGHCTERITIRGNEIYKIIDYVCKEQPRHVINLNTTLLVGNFYSDTPGVLVEVSDKTCLREQFYLRDNKWSSTATYLDALECEKIKVRIDSLRELYQKWLDYYKEQQTQAQGQLLMLQSHLLQLQQQLFGGLFAGNPFG